MNAARSAIAYVLHARAFRERSQLLDLLTADEGRLQAVWRGAGSRAGAAVQSFIRLELAWTGRGPLYTLSRCEELGRHGLHGERAICGLYVNELACRLLPRELPLPGFFDAYERVLHALADMGQAVEAPLRRYELALLGVLGEGLEFIDAGTLDPAQTYVLEPQNEPAIARRPASARDFHISGRALQALLRDELADRELHREARLLLRGLLDYHLGGRKIHSRQLIARGRTESPS